MLLIQDEDAVRKLFPPGALEAVNSVGATRPHRVRLVEENDSLPLTVGGKIAPVDVEYEMYGTLNADKSNVVVIFHALSGDAHVAGWDMSAVETGRRWRLRKPGWWDEIVGPNKAIDTERWCVICVNALGSCYGTTGPSSINPATGKPYALSFPIVTVEDWVRLQVMLLDHLGIERVHAVIGGSLGGQQVIEFMMAFPDRTEKAIVLAASSKLSAQGLAFNAVGRHTIMNDPNFSDGDYYDRDVPGQGLAAARMLAHITYLSEIGMETKFGRRLQNKTEPDFDFGIEFEVESYLAYQGRSFVERFDANSYLYITRAMDYYDAAATHGGGNLTEACSRVTAESMVVSFSSDWLYPPNQCRELAIALSQFHRPVTYIDVPSSYGHDAFLVETEIVGRLVSDFLGREVADG
ncbi:MAG TPA: homoserine O-acetyltransferase [Firmicutes bacterium]|nr:homoserine O-acetyltransferase [Bacillota bacterium]